MLLNGKSLLNKEKTKTKRKCTSFMLPALEDSRFSFYDKSLDLLEEESNFESELVESSNLNQQSKELKNESLKSKTNIQYCLVDTVANGLSESQVTFSYFFSNSEILKHQPNKKSKSEMNLNKLSEALRPNLYKSRENSSTIAKQRKNLYFPILVNDSLKVKDYRKQSDDGSFFSQTFFYLNI